MKNKSIKYILFSVVITSSLLFTACRHEHTFTDATCTTPKTCTECGEIEGDALGHIWVDATCENLKTCSVCNLTEGDILEHVWTEDNKICDLCGIENPDYDNPEEYAAEDYYDTEETIAESEAAEPDLTFNVDILEMTAEGYKKDLEAGKISQETYDILMGFLEEAENLADENGDFSLDEVYEQTDAKYAADGSSGYTTSTEQSSYQPDYASPIQHGDEGLGANGSTELNRDPRLAGIRSN